MALGNLRSSVYMSFLRPLALPRASTLSRFLSTSTSTSASSPAAIDPTTVAFSSIQSQTPQQLTYRVTRTPSQQLPIYLLAKRGGNLKQTRLKKIEGNIANLRADLQKALGIVEDAEIQINHLTKHIIVKGHRKPEVVKFLEERKF